MSLSPVPSLAVVQVLDSLGDRGSDGDSRNTPVKTTGVYRLMLAEERRVFPGDETSAP